MITYPTDTGQEKASSQVKASLQLSGVGKKYPLRGASACGDFWALKDINFEVKEREMVGIIGRNGAGKTSLLNIISGTLSPTEGSVIRKGKILGLFSLGVGFQDELTGRENIFLNGAILGAGKKELNDKISFIIEFSELGDFIDMPLGSYSQGMRLRLGFSVVTALDFDILVIDEILAVGDALFQNKCFQRLLDFKRQGKTIVITSQSLDLLGRLCDKVALIDHGKLLFFGSPEEGIGKYRLLLNTEKFSVGPINKSADLVTDTKKWADNIADWGKKFGSKEVVIDSVEFINRFGCRTNKINTLDNLKIRVSFTIRFKVENPHFGIAIFRNDGVYCYGPNTIFDRHTIPKLSPGKGYFMLDYRSLLLAPGEYKLSIAIWDKNETLAYDYHYGYYELTITGAGNNRKELLNMPFRVKAESVGQRFGRFFSGKKNKLNVNPDLLMNKSGQMRDADNIKLEYIKISGRDGSSKDVFMTNDNVGFAVGFADARFFNKNLCLWLGIYRDDGVYCQGVVVSLGRRKCHNIFFPRLSLLPGLYHVSIGVWDFSGNKFMMYHHRVYPLKIAFDRQDHGTVFLEHKWRWGAR
ncbi:ATP-binding cassette domain-containing protein [bacterium]|nr:MAG: ATP-binding cassette domain-containing protein [bacterium]